MDFIFHMNCIKLLVLDMLDEARPLGKIWWAEEGNTSCWHCSSTDVKSKISGWLLLRQKSPQHNRAQCNQRYFLMTFKTNPGSSSAAFTLNAPIILTCLDYHFRKRSQISLLEFDLEMKVKRINNNRSDIFSQKSFQIAPIRIYWLWNRLTCQLLFIFFFFFMCCVSALHLIFSLAQEK